MDLLDELQAIRTQIIHLEEAVDSLIIRVQSNQENADNVSRVNYFDSIYPLAIDTSVFKGKKPTGVILPNGERIYAHTWKKVVEILLKECNSDKTYHYALIKLRGKVGGRGRTILGQNDDKMRSPFKIDDELYFETHYDTETLLRILTRRIFDPIGYNYRNIKIAIRNS